MQSQPQIQFSPPANAFTFPAENSSLKAEEISPFMRNLFYAATGAAPELAQSDLHVHFAANLKASGANRGRKSILAPSEFKALFGKTVSEGASVPAKWLINGEAWLNLQGIYG
jgi:hypothetical protein